MEKEKLRYGVERKNIFVRLSATFLLLAALTRLLGCWGFWKNGDSLFAYTQVLLPIACCVFFAAIILFGGKKLFFLTFLPVIFGAVFFILRALSFDGVLRSVLCIVVYLAAALLYCGTVFGLIRTKWLLPPIFALALAYKLFFDKTVDFGSMSVKALLPELSVMCILLALLLIPFAMKKRDLNEKPPEVAEAIDLLLENETPLEGNADNSESEAENNE